MRLPQLTFLPNPDGDPTAVRGWVGHQSIHHNTRTDTSTTTKKGTQMSNASNVSRSLLHRIGVAGPARVRAFQGAGVSIGLVVAIAVLLAPGTASAAFTRKFERAIYRSTSSGGHLFTAPCTEAEAKAPSSPCLNPGGVAVNPEGAVPGKRSVGGRLGVLRRSLSG